ncbi:MAG TPA: hypothetical protein VH277_03140 [Gemmatimonadaceae bacterium]|nr:hypothetical protein [Gemmatimonadaceae bacterium]
MTCSVLTRCTCVGIAVAGLALAGLAAPARAQHDTSAVAPVPRQIVTARSLFISNDGADTYGSETYYRLTRFDGGPDRLYNSYYTAVKTDGHFTLADSPAGADVVVSLRFANPFVEKENEYSRIYDPQVTARLVDPKTRITLWTLTEHIELARSRDGDNANFDSAVGRLVHDFDLLTADSASSVAARAELAAPPVGAAAARHRQHLWRNVVAGVGIGGLVGVLIDAHRSSTACGTGFDQCAQAGHFPGALTFTLSGTALGALIGLLLPAD